MKDYVKTNVLGEEITITQKPDSDCLLMNGGRIVIDKNLSEAEKLLALTDIVLNMTKIALVNAGYMKDCIPEMFMTSAAVYLCALLAEAGFIANISTEEIMMYTNKIKKTDGMH